MSEFIDVFTPRRRPRTSLPHLLDALEGEEGREAVIERLAAPGRLLRSRLHHPEDEGDELPKLNKLELTEEQIKQKGNLPTTCIVTPAHRVLGEVPHRDVPRAVLRSAATAGRPSAWGASAGIPRTRSSPRWSGPSRSPTSSASWPRPVGDHPDIEPILREANKLGFRTSVSSIRIPAVTEGVLDALHASGDRSITLAPETGTDELRVKMGKPIKNEFLLEKIRLIFRHGFTQLKLYFLIGLPGEDHGGHSWHPGPRRPAPTP